MNKGQLPTRNIRKPGDVGNFNIRTFTKISNGLKGWSFEIPASAYCHPLPAIKKGMEIRTIEIISNTLFILLILVLIYIAIRKPKDFFIKFPLDVLKALFKWHLIEDFFDKTQEDKDFEYKCERKIKIDFKETEKYILAFCTEEAKIKQSISEGIASLNQPALSGESYNKGDYSINIKLPKNIDFYTYHYLLQWLDNDKIKNAGYVSGKVMEYVVYQDSNSLNNLIGETDNGDRISISLYKDYEKSQFLMVDRRIKLDKLKRFKMISEMIKSTAGNKMHM